MDNFLTFLVTKKGVMTVCASVSTVTFGSYQFNDYVQERTALESLQIQFKEETPAIEYGDTNYDVTALIESKEGDITLPAVNTTTVGEQTLTFKVSRDGQEKEFTKVVEVKDTQAPQITLNESSTIAFESEFDPTTLVQSVSDPVDGTIPVKSEEATVNYYVIDSNVDSATPGDYSVTVKAVDKNGNESSASTTVTVKEKEKTAAEIAKEKADDAALNASSAAEFASGNAVADAALAQLGVSQDCTALVSNALAAVGINYHGYPAGYLSLGTVVSAADAQPGDVIYYADSGIGTAHVAIYIGNGQAVHGGWKGTTAIASAYIGTGPVFIRLR